ncbi:MAG: nucleoside triphosphate pyrophosphohydrolase [Oscillospiraceae bacterium]|nr:nucleoside triphosphate pyrophosphohydrolase [Oscillospiraceae bacterium]
MEKKTVYYQKLVRDKIPAIITATGKTCRSRILSREEYIAKLDEKLSEELAEYQQSKDLEELADLLEVMEAVVKARGFTWQELLQVRDEKRAKRGGFEDRILLEEVTG